jgi:hypothetical protein
LALRSNARNWLFFAAALKGIPVAGATYLVMANPKPIDDLGRALMGGAWVAFLLLVVGALLVGRGSKIGMWVAAPSLLLMMCGFPVGTIFSLVIAKKVSDAADAGALT